LIDEYNQPSPDDFDGLFDPIKTNDHPYQPHSLKLPPECKRLDDGSHAAERFLRYLAEERGFGEDAENVAMTYSLHYAYAGVQAWRVVFPVSFHEQLVAWTGRSIYRNATLRYKADDAGHIKEHLANADVLMKEKDKKILAIAEGPMDFMKLDFYGRELGLHATCTFGTAWSGPQLAKLIDLVRMYEKSFVVFDRAAYMEGAALAEELSAFCRRPVHPVQMYDEKDPGDMNAEQVAEFVESRRDVK